MTPIYAHARFSYRPFVLWQRTSWGVVEIRFLLMEASLAAAALPYAPPALYQFLIRSTICGTSALQQAAKRHTSASLATKSAHRHALQPDTGKLTAEHG